MMKAPCAYGSKPAGGEWSRDGVVSRRSLKIKLLVHGIDSILGPGKTMGTKWVNNL